MKSEEFMRWFMIALALFTIYVGYQVLLIILGGSWSIESGLMAIIIVILGLAVANSSKISSLQTDMQYIKHKTYETANELKEHKKEATENFHKIDLKFTKIDNRLGHIELRLSNIDAKL